MTIKITPTMVETARKIEAGYKSNIKQVGKYKLNEPDRFFNGALGELAFIELLKQQHKKFYYKPQFKGADKGDVIVYLPENEVPEGYPFALDVKTCANESYEYMIVPYQQYKRMTRIAYVGVRLGGSKAEVLGYANHADLKDLGKAGKFKISNYGLLLTELKPIENVLEKIIKGHATIDLSNLSMDEAFDTIPTFNT